MEQSKIWDHFQNSPDGEEAAFHHARPRYERMAAQVRPGSVVLTIGVGRGGLEALLLNLGVKLSCLDPSAATIDWLRSRFDLGENARIGFSQEIPFEEGKFDAVIMSEVLEHLDDDVLAATLLEVKRVLKPAGRFIGTVPADEKLLENRVMCPHCGLPFHRWGHVQSFDRKRVESTLLSQFGDVEIARHYFGDPRTLNWKGRVGWVTKKLLVYLGFKGSNETFSFVAINR